MKRQVNMNEISDGKLYGSNDMVKADCGDCEGCSAALGNVLSQTVGAIGNMINSIGSALHRPVLCPVFSGSAW